MVVFDTDIYSLVHGGSAEGATVRSRAATGGSPQHITVVTVEEHLRGRIKACHQTADPAAYGVMTGRLVETVRVLSRSSILAFDDRAAARFRELKAQRIRIGTIDLRIASIVLARDGLLISRNLKDFRKVPDLRVEDWTR